MVYQSESDFENERIIPRAFELNIGNSKRKVVVSARTISNLNYAFSAISTDIFSIKLNYASEKVSQIFYKPFHLSFAERSILTHSSKSFSGTVYNYDLIVEPVGYDFEPGQYFYSIIFTLSEQ